MTRHVLVTGASKGIGLATVHELANRGFTVFAGVRREEDAAEMAATEPRRIHPLVFDVTDEAARRAAVEHIAELAGEAGLYGVVNNAGIALAAPIEFVPIEELRRQFEVNVFSLVAMSQLCLPLLRQYVATVRSGAGGDVPGRYRRARLVNVSSIGGRIAFSPSGPYTASKFAVESLTDTLRMEVERQGIRVAAVEPGTVRTPLWDKALEAGRAMQQQMPVEATTLYGDRITKAIVHAERAPNRGIRPDAVARVVARALTARRPRTRYLVGPDARLAARLVAPLPDRLRDALLRLRG